ncbi:MAG: DNA cytosine methyltransferase [Roseiarcus sp.]|jgi:DNA (cytosine-5)-methyltransferase 1
MASKPKFFEFFAGGGMARAGLGEGWECLFANDFDAMKVATYAANWGGDHIVLADVARLSVSDLPGRADLVWASFPCQDLSLAGDYRGLGRASSAVKTRSGTFWPFWRLVKGLIADGRAPRLIVLENVYGALTSNGGRDFAAIGQALSDADYRFGAMVIDARRFIPQSRPRVFFVAARHGENIPAALHAAGPDATWHPPALAAAQSGLSAAARDNWVWWDLPRPAARNTVFADLVEEHPTGVRWRTDEETRYLISLMSDVNLRKIDAAKKLGRRMVGAVYRRTRPDENGQKRQRAEVRFDEIAGCLRTPAGGSSRQTIMVVDGERVRSRLLSAREAARLMGLDDSYVLPERYNDAYHVCGDGVAVPVVRHVAQHILRPILEANPAAMLLAAE